MKEILNPWILCLPEQVAKYQFTLRGRRMEPVPDEAINNGMRVLGALKILEAATIECKTRDIDTAEVTAALAMLEPYCRSEWRIIGFREQLKRWKEFGPGGEAQQQVLEVYFRGIHDGVRKLLPAQIGKLNRRHRKIKDTRLKAKLDHLTTELAVLAERWKLDGR